MLKNKWIIVFMVLSLASWAEAKIKVVTTFSDFATIAEAVGENLVEVEHLSHGDQDPHFVPPKPSLAIKLKKADMLVSTGQDLEMWLTTLQDKARNKNIMDGAIGFVTVSPGIEILEKPEHAISRSEGDVHIHGNPHIHTSPLNWIEFSKNILIGLKKVDAQNADTYETNQRAFVDRVHRSMFGDALVNLIGGEQLVDLQRAGTLFDFLESEYEGELLKNKLGGWLKQAMPFRGLDMVAYHKNWAYFAKEFGLNIVGFIESKPGIPPTPKHVEQTIQLIKDRGISVMLVASYFERRKPATIAQKTGIQALFLPLSVGAVEYTEDNFKLMDFWIKEINQAIGQ
ncbi:zinc ABC transporter substrate-binding protein [candidate division KSB1 bacterium]|nr:zinc ABC transporter substrate-binding protein [candidate division KSB1 bacterium]